MLAIIAIVIFFILFLVMLIFIGLADKHFNKAKCGVYYIPTSLIDGVSDDNAKFIGLEGIETIYGHLENEIP